MNTRWTNFVNRMPQPVLYLLWWIRLARSKIRGAL